MIAGPDLQCIFCRGALDKTPRFIVTDKLALGRKIPYRFHRCSLCGSDILAGGVDEGENSKTYEENYMFSMDEKGGRLRKALQKAEWNLFYKRTYLSDARLIEKYMGGRRFRLLDVGCGSGLRVKCFGEYGFDARGIETSHPAVEYAANKLGCDVRLRSLRDCVIARESYDIVTSYAVLEHITDPSVFIADLVKLLKPGGLLLLRVPLAGSFQMRIFAGSHSLYREAPRHVWIPSFKAMTENIEKFGLSLIGHRSEPLLSAASHASLSLFPMAANAIAVKVGLRGVFYRLVGALLAVFPGIPLALADSFRGVGAHTDFVYRKS
ncbi:MAG: methyltransferase domain-containing protein [Candidatus Omnitrophica bacterium]|nr:methyltransferase domain-containing protein [Candidatus Omnitrophota bacterium]